MRKYTQHTFVHSVPNKPCLDIFLVYLEQPVFPLTAQDLKIHAWTLYICTHMHKHTLFFLFSIYNKYTAFVLPEGAAACNQ